MVGNSSKVPIALFLHNLPGKPFTNQWRTYAYSILGVILQYMFSASFSYFL